ncbi:hypothetical protein ACFVSW_00395 [Neobacillus sp. NPDC058068]|uniref:RraA family protein n=1 Tax=Neobacillus sp. NPDC058068 TaxID=3346325 RepID=UPI0036DB637B
MCYRRAFHKGVRQTPRRKGGNNFHISNCAFFNSIFQTSVYSRGSVVATAHGRIMEEATNVMIQFGGVQVRPGDVVIADRTCVVIVPWECVDDVLAKAEMLYEKEEAMIADLRAGLSSKEVDTKYSYEKMLKY